MTQSNSFDLDTCIDTRIAPTLTDAQEERILEKFTEDPDEVITFYNSPEEESSDNRSECRFAVVKRGRAFDVYSRVFGYRGGWEPLEFGASFPTYKEARAWASESAAEVEAETEDYLDSMKDEEWERSNPESTELEAPFTFTDNTDHEDGWELEDEEDVFRFFQRQGLLRYEEWGNAYSCGLVDANGTSCWVAESHRGEMRLYAE